MLCVASLWRQAPVRSGCCSIYRPLKGPWWKQAFKVPWVYRKVFSNFYFPSIFYLNCGTPFQIQWETRLSEAQNLHFLWPWSSQISTNNLAFKRRGHTEPEDGGGHRKLNKQTNMSTSFPKNRREARDLPVSHTSRWNIGFASLQARKHLADAWPIETPHLQPSSGSLWVGFVPCTHLVMTGDYYIFLLYLGEGCCVASGIYWI